MRNSREHIDQSRRLRRRRRHSPSVFFFFFGKKGRRVVRLCGLVRERVALEIYKRVESERDGSILCVCVCVYCISPLVIQPRPFFFSYNSCKQKKGIFN